MNDYKAESEAAGISGSIVIAAATFNAAFAVLNAHVTLVSPVAVVAGEVLIIVAAHCYALCNYRPEMAPWYLLSGLMIIAFCIRSAVTGEFDPKFARDVLIIPTFIILGISSSRYDMDRSLFVLMSIVTVVGIIEAFFPEVYSDLFDVKSYYMQTRGNLASEFYAQDSLSS